MDISTLLQYNACDISDALLRLNVTSGGVLPDISLRGQRPTKQEAFAAPASTVLFVPKGATPPPSAPQANIPKGSHWADLAVPDTFVVIQQPRGQTNAVLGGIMALRMKQLKARGIVVDGRVRDVGELRDTGMPIWSKGLSTVGAGASSSPHAVQVPLDIDGTVVRPGDIIFSDSNNGVVCVPQELVSQVAELLPGLVEADDRVKLEVQRGTSVQEAFKKHRGKA
ncbi:hypothetical protein CFIMG_000309RA [Ceratocystis fimbriata CBS 114723]|uniref:4-hydroxy-4-methyl-2-oxoglutarate aldolase n=1 Tax=Ceratocystis fimbriata CBS 114723 TaxID=1035309 RepID=A0A2C5XIR9_9PEZI|nr:hypothetical protein CFIMG_000309RA [Ceratocystis fimbriata CBS 114723]